MKYVLLLVTIAILLAGCIGEAASPTGGAQESVSSGEPGAGQEPAITEFTEITGCMKITTPGGYKLAADITFDSLMGIPGREAFENRDCIIINTGGVVLDGNGYAIKNGPSSREGNAIVNRGDGNVFKNLVVENVGRSIWSMADGVTIKGNTIRNANTGIITSIGNQHLSITDNTIENCREGMRLSV